MLACELEHWKTGRSSLLFFYGLWLITLRLFSLKTVIINRKCVFLDCLLVMETNQLYLVQLLLCGQCICADMRMT